MRRGINRRNPKTTVFTSTSSTFSRLPGGAGAASSSEVFAPTCSNPDVVGGQHEVPLLPAAVLRSMYPRNRSRAGDPASRCVAGAGAGNQTDRQNAWSDLDSVAERVGPSDVATLTDAVGDAQGCPWVPVFSFSESFQDLQTLGVSQ